MPESTAQKPEPQHEAQRLPEEARVHKPLIFSEAAINNTMIAYHEQTTFAATVLGLSD